MSSRINPRHIIAFIASLVLGGALLWSGLAKINRPYDFLGVVYSYQFVGPRLGLAIAMLLPWLELIVGITLLARLWTNASFLLAIALGVLFVYVETSALHRTLPISCGCFDLASPTGTVNYATLMRAAIFLLIAIVGVWSSWRPHPPDQSTSR